MLVRANVDLAEDPEEEVPGTGAFHIPRMRKLLPHETTTTLKSFRQHLPAQCEVLKSTPWGQDPVPGDIQNPRPNTLGPKPQNPHSGSVLLRCR